MTSLAKQLQQFSEIMQKIEENEGEISNDLLPALTTAEASIAEKIDSYVGFYDAVGAQIDKTKKVLEKFKTRLKTLENLENRLKDNVKFFMTTNNLIKLEGDERSMTLVTAGGVQPTYKPENLYFMQECVNPDYLINLHEHVEEKVVYVIRDKDKFKQAVKENKFQTCYLLPRGKYVKFT